MERKMGSAEDRDRLGKELSPRALESRRRLDWGGGPHRETKMIQEPFWNRK